MGNRVSAAGGLVFAAGPGRGWSWTDAEEHAAGIWSATNPGSKGTNLRTPWVFCTTTAVLNTHSVGTEG